MIFIIFWTFVHSVWRLILNILFIQIVCGLWPSLSRCGPNTGLILELHKCPLCLSALPAIAGAQHSLLVPPEEWEEFAHTGLPSMFSGWSYFFGQALFMEESPLPLLTPS